MASISVRERRGAMPCGPARPKKKRAGGTSSRPRTTTSSGRRRCCCGTAGSTHRPESRPKSIARDDRGSSRFLVPLFILLDGKFAQMPFGMLHVFEREFSCLDKMRHDRLRPAAEQRQEIVDQAALGILARNQRAIDVGAADFLDPPDRLFGFH